MVHPNPAGLQPCQIMPPPRPSLRGKHKPVLVHRRPHQKTRDKRRNEIKKLTPVNAEWDNSSGVAPDEVRLQRRSCRAKNAEDMDVGENVVLDQSLERDRRAKRGWPKEREDCRAVRQQRLLAGKTRRERAAHGHGLATDH